MHKTIKKVGEDIENMKFNTALAAINIMVNEGIPQDPEHAEEWKSTLARLLHPRDELSQHLVIFAGKKQPHILHLLCILVFTDQPRHARPEAAANLIL